MTIYFGFTSSISSPFVYVKLKIEMYVPVCVQALVKYFPAKKKLYYLYSG